jgi:hypothetical protein
VTLVDAKHVDLHLEDSHECGAADGTLAVLDATHSP